MLGTSWIFTTALSNYPHFTYLSYLLCQLTFKMGCKSGAF